MENMMFVWVDGFMININAIEYIGKVYGDRGTEKFTIYLNSGRDITIFQQYGSKNLENIRMELLEEFPKQFDLPA
jgi:hypothetical protein